jgi:5-methyltetrahydrofolate--homocysteine methyltransferase
MADHLEIIKNNVIQGKHREVKDHVRRALDDGLDPDRIINEALIPAMDVVGKEFGAGHIFVPEMLVSAVTMKNGVEVLKPLLSGAESRFRGTIITATVKGDLHDIGKNLVAMMLEGAGFKVFDLGVDLSAEELIGNVKTIKPDILGLSALLTTTMPEMKNVIHQLEMQGLRKSLSIMVGGAPVDRAFAKEIGADGYGANAAEAVDLARRFMIAKPA